MLGVADEAERLAQERNARFGMLRPEPSMMDRGMGMLGRLFMGNQNMYGNDPMNPSVFDSNTVRPELVQDAVLDVVGGPMQIAYHGSPHLFKKFDMSKIGAGQGAQAYGHGLYFAENPKVAKEYANMLGHKGWEYTPEVEKKYRGLYNDLEGQWKSLERLREKKLRESYFTPDGYEHLKDYDHPEVVPIMNQMHGLEEQLVRLDNKMKSEGGREITSSTFYKVDIPDEHIDKMLDWDKTLGQQSIPVREKALQALKDVGYTDKEDIEWLMNNPASHVVDWIGKGSKERASSRLRGHGIKGIKYLDQGSRGAGKGTSNFVLFDDQIPQILEINDNPLKGMLSK